ncbi:DNA cytosine methyltransferase [Deinococcus soli (ex Cha et al. 2016)]|nr:DNA cytosine methyltransferase [Deinococcus soli (ex Cha et al. 2016)]
MGRSIDIAINHDAEAICLHEANHPTTRHFNESVWDVDPAVITERKPVALVWLSPDCTHFSTARGGVPVKKNIRGLAWIALRWISKTSPRVLMLENVAEFKTWGPLMHKLDADGNPMFDDKGNALMVPDPKKKGRTFTSFINALKRHGYEVDHRVMRACDYGAPTTRERFFLIARRDGLPIKWPEPTHGDPASEAVRSGALLPWRTAAECIDWQQPGVSIFGRKKPLAPKTHARLAKGLHRFVLDTDEPFIVPTSADAASYLMRNNHGAKPCDDLREPTRTVTTQTNHLNLVTAQFAGAITTFQENIIGQHPQTPLGTVMAGATRFGAVQSELSPTSGYLVPRYGEREGQEPRAQSVQRPLPTVTPSANGARFAQVTFEQAATTSPDDAALPFISTYYGGVQGEGRGRLMSDPLATQTAENRFALVMPHITKFNSGSVGTAIDSPVATITAGGASKRPAGAPHGLGLVGAELSPVTANTSKQLAFIMKNYTGVTGHGAGRPLGAVTTVDHHSLVSVESRSAAWLEKYYGNAGGQTATDPLHTIGSRDTFGAITTPLINAFMMRQFGTATGSRADRPLGTVMSDGAGGKSGVATVSAEPISNAFVVRQFGESVGSAASEPVGTVMATGQGKTAVAATIAQPSSSVILARAQRVYEFLQEHNPKALTNPGVNHALRVVTVEVNGEPFMMTDITLRMLNPRELYKAQGFPADYIIDPKFNGKKLSMSAQVRMCGNSVVPAMARALVQANLVDPVKQFVTDKAV